MATRRKSTRRTTAARPTPATPKPGPGERLFVLDVPFPDRAVASANGARWDAASRQTIFIGRSLPPGLAPYAAPDYSWQRYLEDDLNGSVQSVAAGESRMKPRPHQMTAAKAIAEADAKGWRGFVEADDVGVGKTVATLAGVMRVAKRRNAQTMLIVCPKGVVAHWRNTLAAVGGVQSPRIVVINYEQTKKLLKPPKSAEDAKRTRTKNQRTATAGIPLVNWDIVVADESHKLKNDSQRSRAMGRIARYAETAKTAPFVVWMSATIGQNPAELSYLSPLLAQMTGATRTALSDFGQWLADQGYAVEYNARFDTWEWGKVPAEATEAEKAVIEARCARDLKRMNALLFGPDAPSIRRLPTDVAGWPEIQRMLHPVGLDLGEQVLYASAWSEFRSSMNLAARGRDPKGAMAARVRFRQKASLIRVAGTVEHVLDLVENGHQVAVSTEWIESLDAIRDGVEKAGVACAEFSGRNPSVREQERLRFQRGQAQVILFTVKEGISLQAGEPLPDGTAATSAQRSTIVHDPRYSGLDAIQVEGRCHRDGQFARVYYCYAQGTVEEDITRRLLSRVGSTKAMSGDDVSMIRALEGVLDRAALT